jgi:RNase P/RNase MRP subunit p30
MRRFVDLNVSASVDLTLLRHLGWRAVALASTTSRRAEPLTSMGPVEGLHVARRLNLTGAPSRRLLFKARRLVEVVAVKPVSVEQARVAARSGAADLLSPPVKPSCFNEGVASLMASTGVALELNLSTLIKEGCPSKLLSQYRGWYRLAKLAGVEVVFSSGASTSLEARSPRDLASLASLITLSVEEALEALSNIPWRVLERGRRRLSEGYIMPGVRVVEG